MTIIDRARACVATRPPAIEGHGVGSKLVRGALDAARDQGLRVVPQCPFVAAYIKRHPEYEDLLA